jgi:hypothetical protein
MIIVIPIDEFEDKFKRALKSNLMRNVSIDYATNALHGSFPGHDDIIIFKFDNYGFFNQNKYNSYSLSYGETGVTIFLTNTNK